MRSRSERFRGPGIYGASQYVHDFEAGAYGPVGSERQLDFSGKRIGPGAFQMHSLRYFLGLFGGSGLLERKAHPVYVEASGAHIHPQNMLPGGQRHVAQPYGGPFLPSAGAGRPDKRANALAVHRQAQKAAAASGSHANLHVIDSFRIDLHRPGQPFGVFDPPHIVFESFRVL